MLKSNFARLFVLALVLASCWLLTHFYGLRGECEYMQGAGSIVPRIVASDETDQDVKHDLVSHSPAGPTRATEARADSIEWRDGFDSSMVGDYRSPLYKASVIGGLVTREMYGVGYDDRLAEIAEEILFSSLDTSELALRFSGMESIDAYGELERSLSDSDPGIALELKQLFEESDALANEVADCYEESWKSGSATRTTVAGTDEAVPVAWMGRAVRNPERGVFRQYKSVRVGDRDFYLSFNSADFPGLDHRLKSLEARRNRFLLDLNKRGKPSGQ